MSFPKCRFYWCTLKNGPARAICCQNKSTEGKFLVQNQPHNKLKTILHPFWYDLFEILILLSTVSTLGMRLLRVWYEVMKS
jgi:hypothetical protein